MMTIEDLIRDLEKDERVLLVDPISTLNCTVGYLIHMSSLEKQKLRDSRLMRMV